MPLKTSHHLFLFVLFAICGVIADSQYAPKPDPLFTAIQTIDARIVDAYNQCDIASLAASVSDEFNSDRDQTGRAADQTPAIDTVEQNIVQNITASIQRVWEPKVLQVCPMQDVKQ